MVKRKQSLPSRQKAGKVAGTVEPDEPVGGGPKPADVMAGHPPGKVPQKPSKTRQKPTRNPPASSPPPTTPPVKPSCYRPHPGEPHDWTIPLPQLSGGRACRNCGLLEATIRRLDAAERKKEKTAKKKKTEKKDESA